MPKFLTVWFFCLTDKSYTNPKLSLINIPALNYLLRSQIFVNDDGQLRTVHLILDFEPISRSFLDVGNSIRADDYSLARIDVSRPNFLAPHDLPPVAILSHKEYHLPPSHYNKYLSGRPLLGKELLLLLLLKKKLIDSSLKKKPSLYRRLKKGQTSIRAFRVLPK